MAKVNNKNSGYDDPTSLDATLCGRTWSDALERFVQDLQTKSYADKTVQFYKTQVNGVARRATERGIKLSDFKGLDMAADIRARESAGISFNSTRHAAVAAKVFFRFCKKRKIVAIDRMRDYHIPATRKTTKFVPTDVDLNKLLKSIRDDYRPSHNRSAMFASTEVNRFRAERMVAVISVAVDTAARIHEILALRVQDVRFNHLDIQFQKVKNQKGHVHTVPMSSVLAETLEKWIRFRRTFNMDNDLLFPSEIGTRADPSSFSRVFKRRAESAGLAGMTFHSLRHYSITQFAETDLLAAQTIAGHKDTKTTMLYIHESAKHLRDAHNKAAPLSGIFCNARSEKQRLSRAKII